MEEVRVEGWLAHSVKTLGFSAVYAEEKLEQELYSTRKKKLGYYSNVADGLTLKLISAAFGNKEPGKIILKNMIFFEI